MSQSPFSSFRVEPAYGAYNSVVRLKLKPGYSGDVYLYRSMTGGSEWDLLNPGAPITMADGASYVFGDINLITSFNDRPYYRGLLDPAGGGPETWLKGEPVAPFSFVNPKQGQRASVILKREYRALSGRKGDGTRVFHCIPLEDGEAVSHYDEETGQILGPDCPRLLLPYTDGGGAVYLDGQGEVYRTQGNGEDGYGTPYKGGFHIPLQTWVKIISAKPFVESSPDATRTTRDADVTLRLLAHPQPREGHMIAIPDSDRRYVISDPITPFYFPGTDIPIAWEAGGLLLPTTDARHRLPLPPVLADPVA